MSQTRRHERGPQPRRLFELIHVSDLHFGRTLAERVASRVGVEGWEIHDPGVVSRLSRSIQTLADDCNNLELPYRVICSGDLTTWGSREALHMAQSFLRNRAINRDIGHRVCLPDPGTPYVPGNHDVWKAWPPPLTKLGLTPIGREQINLNEVLYWHSCPDNIDHSDLPYRRNLYEDDEVVLRLYGFDSTRLHCIRLDDVSILKEALQEAVATRRFTQEQLDWIRQYLLGPYSDVELSNALAALAGGFVESHHLDMIHEWILDEERSEFVRGRRRLIRLAMIHHPIAYRETRGPEWDWTPDRLRRLWNLGDVQTFLQKHRFFGVMCGHQHVGFDTLVQPDPSLPPFYVFSCGTSSQKVGFTLEERQFIREMAHGLVPPTREQRQRYDLIASRMNEFVTYLLCVDNGEYTWITRSYRKLPHADFTPESTPSQMPVRFAVAP